MHSSSTPGLDSLGLRACETFLEPNPARGVKIAGKGGKNISTKDLPPALHRCAPGRSKLGQPDNATWMQTSSFQGSAEREKYNVLVGVRAYHGSGEPMLLQA
ncbi:hypothetical protein Y1Q_0005764 [Alligator mississippiensis]|uniref:Uncharacterized protein n=1 Tax=Alligator mississippiensis TaxID=8496 RepID=A0A151MFS9_ALLMI|nr:hypothetical protein Y1Q_0005764 [Alligator mississippiensis]